MEHTIDKTPDGFTCAVCKNTWKSAPISSCPGVVEYGWQQAPENLKTENQLKRMRLHPGPRRGIVGEWWLYDVGEAIPYTAEELSAARAKARLARQRKCAHCGRTVDRRQWDSKYDACRKCLPAAIEKHKEEIRLRREAEKREFREYLSSSRDEEILWARSLLGRSDWVILDTETTGLQSFVDELVSISIMGSNGEILVDTLIKPSIAISAGAGQVNGLTAEMLADAPIFVDIWPKIQEALQDRTVIVYNVDFDYWMLMGTCNRYYIEQDERGLPDKRQYWQCAMLKYAAFVGEWDDYRGSFRWQKLPNASHRSSADCMAVLELIREMADARLSAEGGPAPDPVSGKSK